MNGFKPINRIAQLLLLMFLFGFAQGKERKDFDLSFNVPSLLYMPQFTYEQVLEDSQTWGLSAGVFVSPPLGLSLTAFYRFYWPGEGKKASGFFLEPFLNYHRSDSYFQGLFLGGGTGYKYLTKNGVFFEARAGLALGSDLSREHENQVMGVSGRFGLSVGHRF